MEIQGKIKIVGEEKTYGSKGFRKREVVIVTEEQYPQSILVEFVQDKCELLDGFTIDDNVRISINLRGREWINKEGETRYFNSIQGWRIEKNTGESTPPPPPPINLEEKEGSDNTSDDLPF